MDTVETKGIHNRTLVEVLYSITPEQKEYLKRIGLLTGMKQSALVRQAISMLIGSYKDALNKKQ